MFRIRRVFDNSRQIDRDAITAVQTILRSRFSGVPEEDLEKIPDLLRDPLTHRFKYILLVADDTYRKVKGFALVAHAPDLKFCYLDFIAAHKRLSGGGIGGALYQKVREEAKALKAVGVFMECLPDDPRLCPGEEIIRENKARLRFYERFGAFPIVGTAYETALTPESDCPPYLVYDNLGSEEPLRRKTARKIVRAILERKYGDSCPEGYIDMVVSSFKDDPVRVRPPVLIKKKAPAVKAPGAPGPADWIALVVNDRHIIHHVHERGYVESPVRIKSILRSIEKLPFFRHIECRNYPEKHIRAVHDHEMVGYLKKMSQALKPGESVYPYVFPIRNAARPPKELPIRAGYYCIDTFTPLNRNAYLAAYHAVECALTGADEILKGRRLAYALVRPPGHHAEHRAFGGFCYFNSSSVAAHYLSAFGRVAVLDVDYHHGNGTQTIFYSRSDVLTLSIHGAPSIAYPYFSGFKEETGEGEGAGFNINYPMGENLDGEGYRKVLKRALIRIREYRPDFVVLALGLDTARDDPTGSWGLVAKDFEENGRLIGALNLPTLVVQEGGYLILSLGTNARHFFKGLYEAGRTPVK